MKRRTIFFLGLTGLAGCSGRRKPRLNVFNWSDYVAPTTIPRFEHDMNVDVNYQVYESNEEMLAKVFSGNSGWDVVFPSNYYVQPMAQSNLLAPRGIERAPEMSRDRNRRRSGQVRCKRRAVAGKARRQPPAQIPVDRGGTLPGAGDEARLGHGVQLARPGRRRRHVRERTGVGDRVCGFRHRRSSRDRGGFASGDRGLPGGPVAGRAFSHAGRRLPPPRRGTNRRRGTTLRPTPEP